MPTLSELSQKTGEVIYIQESALGGNQGIVFQTALKNGFIHKLYVNSKTTRLAEMGLGKVPQITGTRNQSGTTVHKQGQSDLGRGGQTPQQLRSSAAWCQGKQTSCPGPAILPAWRETQPSPSARFSMAHTHRLAADSLGYRQPWLQAQFLLQD